MSIERPINTYSLSGDIIENSNKERYLVVGYLYIKGDETFWSLDNITRNSKNFEDFKLQYISNFVISYAALRIEGKTVEETLDTNNKIAVITQMPLYTKIGKYDNLKKIESYILKKRLLNKVERHIYTESEIDKLAIPLYKDTLKRLYATFKINFIKIEHEDFMKEGGIYLIHYRNKPYTVIKKGYEYGLLKRIDKYNDIYEVVNKIRETCCYFLDENTCKLSISIKEIEKLLNIEIKWIKNIKMDNVYVLNEDIEVLF